MIFIGIDGGLDGGISVINERQEITHLYPMPIIKLKRREYNMVGINKIFEGLIRDYGGSEIRVMLEQATMSSIFSRLSVASIFFCSGLFQGILTGHKISYEVIRAKVWQKEILAGFNFKDTKKSSILWCTRKYPSISFKRTEKCKKDSDGLTDATCIAVFCWRKNKR